MSTTSPHQPVPDWATDFDHTAPAYNENAHQIWDDLRERCPIAHSDRFGGTWLPTRHEDNPGQEMDLAPEETLEYYIDQRIAEHREQPRDDLISYLLNVELGGQPLSQDHVRGTVLLLLLAGIDTTWSAIGSSLWHLATHPEDRRRLVADPALVPTAVEELLRAYAPVTMARLAARDHQLGGCPIKEGDWMLVPFPAANRDPAVFDQADQVILDRAQNRHAAFGLGIHRCLGSNLARLELRVALEEWLAAMPEFSLAPDTAVRWSTGQIRGPRSLPLLIGA